MLISSTLHPSTCVSKLCHQTSQLQTVTMDVTASNKRMHRQGGDMWESREIGLVVGWRPWVLPALPPKN